MKVDPKSVSNQIAQTQTKSSDKLPDKLAKLSKDPVGLSRANSSRDSAHVELSSKAKDMNKIREVVNREPEVDEAKIAKFTDLIDKGLYKVDAGAVADRLVNEHLLSASMDQE